MAKTVIELEDLLTRYERIAITNGTIRKNCVSSYISSVRRVDRLSGNLVVSWITNAISGNTAGKTPLLYVMAEFDKWVTLSSVNNNKNTWSKLQSYFKDFARTIIGVFKANEWAFKSTKFDKTLCQIVAMNAIFASFDVIEKVKRHKLGRKENLNIETPQEENKYASWDNMTHIRVTNKKNKIPQGLKADDNTIANHAIKRAIIASYGLNFGKYDDFNDYEACHIWDMPGDPRYYASIMNLVLVPRAFGQLTDHCDAVKQLLRYEAHERFGFCPEGEEVPEKPSYYNDIVWRVI